MRAIRHNGHRYTSSLYAGAPDRRPPLSSAVSGSWIELRRRAKLLTGDTVSPWSRPIRIVTLNVVSSHTGSVLPAGKCLSLNAAWSSAICVLDDNYTGCEDPFWSRSSFFAAVVWNRCRIHFSQQQQRHYLFAKVTTRRQVPLDTNTVSSYAGLSVADLLLEFSVCHRRGETFNIRIGCFILSEL